MKLWMPCLVTEDSVRPLGSVDLSGRCLLEIVLV
jgi:hypothetical protein